MDRRQKNSADVLDRAAIALSGLCLLHCIALPLLLIAIPVFEEFAGDHFHLQLLVFVVPVSVFALALGFRRHRRLPPLVAGGVGLLLLFIGATFAHNALGPVADRAFTIGGSLVLAVAHFHNSRLAKRHRRQMTGSC